MQRGPAIFIVLMVLGIAGFLAIDLLRNRKATPPITPAKAAAAPVYVEIVSGPRLPDNLTIDRVMSDFATAPTPILRDTEAQTYQGMYNSDRGWEANVTELRQVADITILRMRVPTSLSSGVIKGGYFWVEATMPRRPEALKVGDRITFIARIDKLQARTTVQGEPETFHMLLDDVRIVQVIPK